MRTNLNSAVTEPVDEATETCAIHEAGHACVGLALGIHVQAAGILIRARKGTSSGLCVVGDEPVSPASMAAWLAESSEPNKVDVPEGVKLIDFLIFLESGHAAAVKLRPGDIAWNDRFQQEQLLADALRLDACSVGVQQVLAVIERAARQHVEQHWPWITAVAEHLVRHHTADADQIRALRPTATATTRIERAAANAAEVTA